MIARQGHSPIHTQATLNSGNWSCTNCGKRTRVNSDRGDTKATTIDGMGGDVSGRHVEYTTTPEAQKLRSTPTISSEVIDAWAGRYRLYGKVVRESPHTALHLGFDDRVSYSTRIY